MSEIGKEIRLSQILNRVSGRTVIVAMDHAPVIGPVKGLIDPVETVRKVLEGEPDTLFMHKGILRKVYPMLAERRQPFLLKVTTTTVIGRTPDKTNLVDSVEYAVKIGASGVSMRTFIGPEHEAEMIQDLGLVSAECDRYGMPLLAMMYPEGVENVYDARYVKHAGRLGAELGADIVKTYYTGTPESFREVVESCPVPVVMSGGPKTDTTEQFLELVKGAIDAGASGVAVGRNVWQHEKPARMIEAIKRVVHDGMRVQEAMLALG